MPAPLAELKRTLGVADTAAARMAVVGSLIREAREELGMTQAQLGGEIGAHRVAVARWESGDVVPGRTWLEKIISVLSAR